MIHTHQSRRTLGQLLLALAAGIGCLTLSACELCRDGDQDCGSRQLRRSLSPQAYERLERYVKESPVILADVGQVEKLSAAGLPTIELDWGDYSATAYLEVSGPKAKGFLSASLSGSSVDDIQNIEGQWTSQSKTTLIGYDGRPDTSRVK